MSSKFDDYLVTISQDISSILSWITVFDYYLPVTCLTDLWKACEIAVPIFSITFQPWN